MVRPGLPRSLQATGSGKEELRAGLLVPYLLRLRDERGEAAARALLSTVGIPGSILEDENEWISVAAARRALHALATALGEEAISRRGGWMTHPETLSSYVRMLRVSSQPLDAYRYLTAHAAESTRVGSYELAVHGPRSLQVTYLPRFEVQPDQRDRRLCHARVAELAAVPRIWGLPEAVVHGSECVADGDQLCRYQVRWTVPRPQGPVWGAIAGAILCGGAVAIAGSWVAATIALAVGTGLGGAIGLLSRRVATEHMARVFEKNRIAALERGLEVRGQFGEPAGELAGSLLGGKYRIQRKIGSGGIGAVYAAQHVGLGSSVAIKVLRGAAAVDAAEIARLRREARVQVSIEHPNVVRTLDLDQMPEGSIYVVMELLQGMSLAEHLKKRGPLPPGFAVPVFIQVCRALSAAHRLGVIHRDLKPGNVFVCDDETVKVLDFGMSKFAEAEALTQDGYTLGTPEYMSPEQCIGAPVEPRTDLYAFGVLMYEALTGELPIAGRSRRDLLELHQRMIPVSMQTRRPDLHLPRELDDAVMMCLKKRAAERPTSAQALEKALASIPAQLLVNEYPEGTPRRAPASHPSQGQV
ncbi:MAG TPA: serine/threonine-protein kinase [Polyangiaceae bacterium]